MKPVDPDLLAVLNTIGVNREARRVEKARKKYDQQTERQLETMVTLLSDEVERVVDRSNPLFESILLLTAIRKIANRFEEPEDASALDVFPNEW
jgi:hypothetical protein